jgi:hypothetical protein
MLVGLDAFQDRSTPTVLFHQLRASPTSPRELCLVPPRTLAAVVKRAALGKALAQRYARPGEFEANFQSPPIQDESEELASLGG